MRIFDAMKNATPANAEALFEKAVSTMTNARVARVYAHATDQRGEVTHYRIEWVSYYPRALQGAVQREGSSETFFSAHEMRAWLREFFAPVELTDEDPRPSVE
jgi:hypothetical protein